MQGKLFGIAESTHTYLLAILNQNLDEVEATSTYLKHQLSLEPRLRVENELSEEDMIKVLKSLTPKINKLCGIIEEVKNLHVKSDE